VEPEGKPEPMDHGPASGGDPQLFVVHAPEDAWFVEGFLLEALRLPDGEVLVSSKLEPGAGRLRDGQRELYVIGPSGSGKSSLVAAGLVPSLRRSPERAGGSYLVRQLRPGADPHAALAGVIETATERNDTVMPWPGDAVGRLLASHPGHDRLLIFEHVRQCVPRPLRLRDHLDMVAVGEHLHHAHDDVQRMIRLDRRTLLVR
jgi:hypothetical protein